MFGPRGHHRGEVGELLLEAVKAPFFPYVVQF